MKNTALLSVALALCMTGCFWKSKSDKKDPAPATTQIVSENQAVDFIQHYIRTNGGDPANYDITARSGRDGQWSVTSWHIAHPEKKDPAERFVPGDYTIYVLSSTGQIINSLPGQPAPGQPKP